MKLSQVGNLLDKAGKFSDLLSVRLNFGSHQEWFKIFRQVFGLMNIRTAAELQYHLLTIASRVLTQCLVMVVVFNYRCGTVPDSHRVPSFDT